MSPYIHIQNLLQILKDYSIQYNRGSLTDQQVRAAQRALIEYNKNKVVTDANTEQTDSTVQRSSEQREGHDGETVDPLSELPTREVRSTT